MTLEVGAVLLILIVIAIGAVIARRLLRPSLDPRIPRDPGLDTAENPHLWDQFHAGCGNCDGTRVCPCSCHVFTKDRNICNPGWLAENPSIVRALDLERFERSEGT